MNGDFGTNHRELVKKVVDLNNYNAHPNRVNWTEVYCLNDIYEKVIIRDDVNILKKM